MEFLPDFLFAAGPRQVLPQMIHRSMNVNLYWGHHKLDIPASVDPWN